MCPTYTPPPVYLLHVAKATTSLSVPVHAFIPLDLSFPESINGTWGFFEKQGKEQGLAFYSTASFLEEFVLSSQENALKD